MPNLSQNFRKSFLAYSKNPNSVKNKENLINTAFAIYEDAVTKCGLEPDKYISHMHECRHRSHSRGGCGAEA